MMCELVVSYLIQPLMNFRQLCSAVTDGIIQSITCIKLVLHIYIRKDVPLERPTIEIISVQLSATLMHF